MNINLYAVGERIRTIRKQHKYSMALFAKLIGNSSASTVNNWEKGNNLPKQERLEKIAILGNTSVEWIKYGTFEEYVLCLLQHAHITTQTLTADQLEILLSILEKKKISYKQDLEILTCTKQLFPHFFEFHYQSVTSNKQLVISEDISVYSIESNSHYRKTILPNLENLLTNSDYQTLLQGFISLLLDCLNQEIKEKQINMLNDLFCVLETHKAGKRIEKQNLKKQLTAAFAAQAKK